MTIQKTFTFRGLDNRSVPQAGETFVDTQRRRWKAVMVIGTELQFGRRGMIEVTKVVAETFRRQYEVN